MPTYQYNGDKPFVSLDYRLSVNPGETVTTKYVLPTEWTDFVLIDASDANAVTPSTMPVTLPPGGQVTIPIEGYDSLAVVKISGDGVVDISLIPDPNPGTKATIGLGIEGLNFNLSLTNTAQDLRLQAPSTNLGNVEVLVIRGTFDTYPVVAGSGSGGGGGSATPSNENMTSRIEYVDTSSSDPLYVGYAPPGSAESDPVWQIRKMEYDAQGRLIAVKFANGELAYNKVWDNRASYTYS